MELNLAALAKRVAKQSIDAELDEILLKTTSTDPAALFQGSRPLAILAICNLIFTKRVYSLESVLAAVESNPNPKLAYCALVYYWRVAKNEKLWVAHRLILLLDEAHLAKSPINKLVVALEFSSAQLHPLKSKFPQIKWKPSPVPKDLASALERDCTAVFDAPDIIADLKPPKRLQALCKCLKAASQQQPFFELVPKSDFKLVATCCSLYFTGAFLDCPFSHQFSPAWLAYLRTLVPAIFSARAWTEFALVPHGTVIFLTFCLAIRPTELPALSLSGPDRAWYELCRLILFGLGGDHVLAHYQILPPKGQLLALDILMRNGGNLLELGPQFVRIFDAQMGAHVDIDVEPLCVLFLVNGHVSLYDSIAPNALAEPVSCADTSAQLVHCIYGSTISTLVATIRANAAPSNIQLLEQSLPTINSLSLKSSNHMLKMELAFILISAVVAKLYAHLGYEAGAIHMRKTGRAKATGLWASYFESPKSELNEFVGRLCQLPTTDSPDSGIASLRKHVRRNVLYGTAEDTALQVSELCGFVARRKSQPSALAQKVLAQWSFLTMPIEHTLKVEWSRLALNCAPALTVLGVPSRPQLERAAENLRHPILEALSAGKAVQGLETHNHIVVTINMCKRALLITRYSAGYSISVRLPLAEQNHCEQFKSLVQQSVHLGRNDAPSDNWWRKQSQLGDQLLSCIQKMDSAFFGSFGGLVSPWCLAGSSHLEDAKAQLVQIYHRFLPTVPLEALQALQQPVVELFLLPAKMRAASLLESEKFQMDFIAQLNYFVLDALRLRGYNFDYDLVDSTELESSLLSYVWSLSLPCFDQKHLVLIPDESLADLPWECFPSIPAESMSRCLSFWHYTALSKARANETHSDNSDEATDDDEESSPIDVASHSRISNSVYYVLNPNSNLKNASEMFSQSFKIRKWQGILDAAPSEKELVGKLRESTCYIYIGHGSGHKFLRSSSIRQLGKCSAVMLFGCSSAKLKNGAGPLIDYAIASCPLFVGFMWDVPNMDCNRFTQEFLRLCFDERLDAFKALQLARRHCKIYTTRLAPVIYGLP